MGSVCRRNNEVLLASVVCGCFVVGGEPECNGKFKRRIFAHVHDLQ